MVLEIEIERAWDCIFAILRCWQEKFLVHWFYWSAQTIRVVSQIYREQNNRGNVSQSENTDVTILIKLIGQYWFFIVVLIWNGKGKYLWMKLLLACSFNLNVFKNLKYVERKEFWLSLNSDAYISSLNLASYITSSCSLFWRGK